MLQKQYREPNRPANKQAWRPGVLAKSFRYVPRGRLQETKRFEDVAVTLSSATPTVPRRSNARQEITGQQSGLSLQSRQCSHLFDDDCKHPFYGMQMTEDVLSPHPFVFDINIHLGQSAGGKTRKVLKRVLLDTGSDLNLISAPAYADLKTSLRPNANYVRSVAGESSVVGETHLQWSFLSFNSTLNSSPALFSDKFFVLSKREAPLFDCILSRHWIQANQLMFLSLWTEGQQNRP